MNVPANLRYTADHEWILLLEDGTALVGITDFAQGELGDLVYIEVDTVGETLDANQIFGSVEAVKTTSDLYLPVAAEILAFNPELDEKQGDNPTVINNDPYGAGWIVKIRPTNVADIDALMSPSAYEAAIG
jgi:glycine cleavage system H protein